MSRFKFLFPKINESINCCKYHRKELEKWLHFTNVGHVACASHVCQDACVNFVFAPI